MYTLPVTKFWHSVSSSSPFWPRKSIAHRGTLQNKKFSDYTFNEFPEIFPDSDVLRDTRHLCEKILWTWRVNKHPSHTGKTDADVERISNYMAYQAQEVRTPRGCTRYSRDNNRCTLLAPSIDRSLVEEGPWGCVAAGLFVTRYTLGVTATPVGNYGNRAAEW